MIATLLALASFLSAATAAAEVVDDLPPSVVVLEGRDLPSLLGSRPNDLRAFALHDGLRLPVLLQVDERWRGDDELHYAYEAGPEPVADLDPTFDSDDLLLFSPDDAGERLPAPEREAVEVQVRDGDHLGWLYVHNDATAPQPGSSLSYDRSRDGVRGDHYFLARASGQSAGFDELRLGDPARAPNILDRTKARIDLQLALGLATLHRTQDDTIARTTALHIGPLRIVREVEVRGRVLLDLYTNPYRERFVYYRDGFSVPTVVWIGPRYVALLRSITLRLSMDLNENARGMTFMSAPELPQPLRIDGHAGRHGGALPLQWYLLRGEQFGLLGWLTADPDVLRNVTLFFDDDSARVNPPENVPGQLGHHGFLYRSPGQLPNGPVRLTTHAWVVTGNDLNDPAAARRRFDHRPTAVVTVR